MDSNSENTDNNGVPAEQNESNTDVQDIQMDTDNGSDIQSSEPIATPVSVPQTYGLIPTMVGGHSTPLVDYSEDSDSNDSFDFRLNSAPPPAVPVALNPEIRAQMSSLLDQLLPNITANSSTAVTTSSNTTPVTTSSSAPVISLTTAPVVTPSSAPVISSTTAPVLTSCSTPGTKPLTTIITSAIPPIINLEYGQSQYTPQFVDHDHSGGYKQPALLPPMPTTSENPLTLVSGIPATAPPELLRPLSHAFANLGHVVTPDAKSPLNPLKRARMDESAEVSTRISSTMSQTESVPNTPTAIPRPDVVTAETGSKALEKIPCGDCPGHLKKIADLEQQVQTLTVSSCDDCPRHLVKISDLEKEVQVLTESEDRLRTKYREYRRIGPHVKELQAGIASFQALSQSFNNTINPTLAKLREEFPNLSPKAPTSANTPVVCCINLEEVSPDIGNDVIEVLGDGPPLLDLTGLTDLVTPAPALKTTSAKESRKRSETGRKDKTSDGKDKKSDGNDMSGDGKGKNASKKAKDSKSGDKQSEIVGGNKVPESGNTFRIPKKVSTVSATSATTGSASGPSSATSSATTDLATGFSSSPVTSNPPNRNQEPIQRHLLPPNITIIPGVCVELGARFTANDNDPMPMDQVFKIIQDYAVDIPDLATNLGSTESTVRFKAYQLACIKNVKPVRDLRRNIIAYEMTFYFSRRWSPACPVCGTVFCRGSKRNERLEYRLEKHINQNHVALGDENKPVTVLFELIE